MSTVSHSRLNNKNDTPHSESDLLFHCSVRSSPSWHTFLFCSVIKTDLAVFVLCIFMSLCNMLYNIQGRLISNTWLYRSCTATWFPDSVFVVFLKSCISTLFQNRTRELKSVCSHLFPAWCCWCYLTLYVHNLKFDYLILCMLPDSFSMNTLNGTA